MVSKGRIRKGGKGIGKKERILVKKEGYSLRLLVRMGLKSRAPVFT